MAAKGFPPDATAPAPAEARALTLTTLKRRADFLRAKEGRREVLPGLVVEACRSPQDAVQDGVARVGVTATRRLGGAVVRNRAKRRLRALAARVLPASAREGHDYVLIARTGTLSRRFSDLEQDLSTALANLHARLDGAAGNRTDDSQARH
jgi:ribonuclease P protein component